MTAQTTPFLADSQTHAPLKALAGVCYVRGDWTVQALSEPGEAQWRREVMSVYRHYTRWDLTAIDRIDTIGAQVLWRVWGGRLPTRVRMRPDQRGVFELLETHAETAPLVVPAKDRWRFLRDLGQAVIDSACHSRELLKMLGQIFIDLVDVLRHPKRAPWREISAQVYHAGMQALGITALVGLLIGVVLSYLSAQQLSQYGANVFIVRLLGVAIVRELGPMLAAILVAGRSGSAITAQLGVMRVTQELDAMRVMGISHSQRLILPRVLGLALAMPLLVVWTGMAAMLGGIFSAYAQLGMDPIWFLRSLRSAISLDNYGIGLGKGVVFGTAIALISCYFGLRVEPNTDSLGRNTTSSVVTAITGVILLDAVFAIVFSSVGI